MRRSIDGVSPPTRAREVQVRCRLPYVRTGLSSSSAPEYAQRSLMAHTITLIPGDGIGPEVASATQRVLEAAGVAIDWDVQEAGAAVAEKRGTRDCRDCLRGAQ